MMHRDRQRPAGFAEPIRQRRGDGTLYACRPTAGSRFSHIPLPSARITEPRLPCRTAAPDSRLVPYRHQSKNSPLCQTFVRRAAQTGPIRHPYRPPCLLSLTSLSCLIVTERSSLFSGRAGSWRNVPSTPPSAGNRRFGRRSRKHDANNALISGRRPCGSTLVAADDVFEQRYLLPAKPRELAVLGAIAVVGKAAWVFARKNRHMPPAG